MENTEQDDPPQSQGEFDSVENKNVSSEEDKNKEKATVKSTGDKDAIKSGQEKFIVEIEKTENLIDPGNEHHHHAGEADKNIA